VNCLITGINGFLGKSIAQEISKSKKIFGLSRTSGEYMFYLENEIPNFKIQFDLVIHTAGRAHSVPKTENEKRQFYQINVVGTKNLLKGLELTGPPKQFVFISSVSVYGSDVGNYIGENHSLDAKDSYGISKIEAEAVILNWCKDKNVVCTILRLPLIVGPNPPGNLGAMIKGIKKRYYFNIAGGKAKKSMVLAEDIAKSILKVAEIGGIYNLTDGYHPSFAELSNHISFQLGKSKPINMPLWLAWFVAKIGDLSGTIVPLNTYKLKKITSDLTFDDSKARNTFGWNPTPVLELFRINKSNL
jgi:nucleoside-diphosphate-sugar epimerase